MSCTQTANEILWHIAIKTPKKASSPDGGEGGEAGEGGEGGPLAGVLDDTRGVVTGETLARLLKSTSFLATHRSEGNPDSMMENSKTMVISSDSVTSDSFAPSSNSWATANAMDSVRSPPKEESVSDAPGVEVNTDTEAAADDDCVDGVAEVISSFSSYRGSAHTVNQQTIKQVACNGYGINRPYCSSSLSLTRPALQFRQLVLTEPSDPSNQSRESRKRSSDGMSVGRAKGRTSTITLTRGTIFGSTLKSILDFVGVPLTRQSCVTSIRCLLRFFEPTSYAISTLYGNDKPHLNNGMGAFCVAKRQVKYMHELREAKRSFLSRVGLKEMAFGATASLLASYHLLSEGKDPNYPRDPRSMSLLCEQLVANAKILDEMLGNWPAAINYNTSNDCGMGGGYGARQPWENPITEALHAEARCIRRARAAANAARVYSTVHFLSPKDTLRLHIEWMRAAAWPQNTPCDAETHSQLCADIVVGKASHLYSSPSFSSPSASSYSSSPSSSSAIPLAALASNANLRNLVVSGVGGTGGDDGRRSDGRRGDDEVSVYSSSIGSSICSSMCSSIGSAVDGGVDGGVDALRDYFDNANAIDIGDLSELNFGGTMTSE